MSYALSLLLAPLSAQAEIESTIQVGPFSEARVGSELPESWEPLIFPKIKQQTRYEVVEDHGIRVIQAISHSAASGMIRKIRIDLKEYPVIEWRWKVPKVITGSDVRSKAGDDYAARIYITFEYDSGKAGFLKKAKYKIGKLLFGDIPISAVNYIWENKTPVGTFVSSRYTDMSKMIVLENANTRVGEWVTEERNVYEDYKKAFSEEPPFVNGVAIMTDTDNTGESATAYYGDIFFKSEFSEKR